jgi:hypothetical protein
MCRSLRCKCSPCHSQWENWHLEGAILNCWCSKVTLTKLWDFSDQVSHESLLSQELSHTATHPTWPLMLSVWEVGGGRRAGLGLLLRPSAEYSAKFPGSRLWEEISFPSIVRKYPCRARNTFPGYIKKKFFEECAKFFHYQQWCFSRIRQCSARDWEWAPYAECRRLPTFWPFLHWKVKNLTWLKSGLSLPFKFVQNHKSRPNSATPLLGL